MRLSAKCPSPVGKLGRPISTAWGLNDAMGRLVPNGFDRSACPTSPCWKVGMAWVRSTTKYLDWARAWGAQAVTIISQTTRAYQRVRGIAAPPSVVERPLFQFQMSRCAYLDDTLVH